MMAKNEIKMLLLGAGESGKVSFSSSIVCVEKLMCAKVDSAQADEAYTQRWLQ